MADLRQVKRDESTRRRPKTRSRATVARGNGHEDVARRAYEIFERRGRQHGRDWEDWFQAERELSGMGTASR